MLLYPGLMRHEPTPVVALNHAVALAEAEGAAADLLVRLDQRLDAITAYDREASWWARTMELSINCSD